MFEVGLPCGFEFGDDALGEDFAEGKDLGLREDIRHEKEGQQEA